jgi:ABC-2 type transport system ATP-binding protein
VPDRVAGFVETPAFYPYLSGRRNLELLARLDGCDDDLERLSTVLDQVGLADADVPVGAYSAGMRQRLGVAAALLRSPQLLMIDEPTSALDPRGAREICALVRDIAHEGAAVVFSSHDMVEVEELCSRLTVIDRGRIIFSGTEGELRRVMPSPVHALRTSDDRVALDLASKCPSLRVTPVPGGGLELCADPEGLDEFVIALGRSGIAVRMLEYRARSLESLFLQLTGQNAATESHTESSHTNESTSLTL